MEKTLPLSERSISQIYKDSSETITYTIPIYQRNYAWEEDEITALIKDVYDSWQKHSDAPYYIGTLVTYKREDNEYEVIDGQQRLTTIYILLKALKVENIKNKLTYSARKSSVSTIQKLECYPNLGEDVDCGIRDGYKYAEKALEANLSKDKIEEFTNYLLHQVHIIHYNVPKDVDLNHYFEVMNSRGEQLEKHEIVKSILSQNLMDKYEMATFCRVWEACSEMNMYIQQAFHEDTVFGKHFHNFLIDSFKKIPRQDVTDGTETIINLLKKPTEFTKDIAVTVQNDRFQPIIDFPNFLLIVLKITRLKEADFKPTDFTLDDKELLKEFCKAIEKAKDKKIFVKQFANNLLKAKYFLDNYIIHHSFSNRELSGDNPWILQKFYMESSKKRYYKNLAEKNEVIQLELVHLLSMFEVSFTPKQRKNYLFYCVLYLFTAPSPSPEKYLSFLQYLAGKYFYDVYLNPIYLNERNQPGPNAFDNAMLKNRELNFNNYDKIDYKQRFIDIYKPGRADIPLFIFNYTDYMLWKKYADELRGKKTKKISVERNKFFKELGCSDFDLSPFYNFYFSRTRKSLEHFYPQAKVASENRLSIEDINCFGNFAMIGTETNSSGSNWNPRAKLSHYNDGKSDQVSVASLKLRIMMQICRDNQREIDNNKLNREVGMEWNAEDMKKHQERILEIICFNSFLT